jgi:hypothetical protein
MLPGLPVHQIRNRGFADMEIFSDVLIAPVEQLQTEGFLDAGFCQLANRVIFSCARAMVTDRVCHVFFAGSGMDMMVVAACALMARMSGLQARGKWLLIAQLPGKAMCTDRFSMDFDNAIARIDDSALKRPTTFWTLKSMLAHLDFAPKGREMLCTAPVRSADHRAKTGFPDSGMVCLERGGTLLTDQGDIDRFRFRHWPSTPFWQLPLSLRFSVAIPSIVRCRANGQMTWSHTGRFLALVTDKHPRQQRSIRQNPCNAMGAHGFAIVAKYAMARGHTSASPQPASTGFVDFRPETFFERQQGTRHWLNLRSLRKVRMEMRPSTEAGVSGGHDSAYSRTDPRV